MSAPEKRGAAPLADAAHAYNSGDYLGAARLLRPHIATGAADDRLTRIYGASLVHSGRPAEGRKVLLRLARRTPRDPGVLHDIAQSHRYEGNFVQARQTIDRGLALLGPHPTLVSMSAFLHQVMGESERAFETIAPLIEIHADHAGVVLAYTRAAHRVGRREEGVAAARRALESDALTGPLRTQLLFQLGALLDGLGRTGEAFAAYQRGNDSWGVSFDRDRNTRAVDALIRGWSPAAIEEAPRRSDAGAAPIFIVGMPRSGSTLIEQIIAAHPHVAPGGERMTLPRLVQPLMGPGDAESISVADPRTLTRGMLEQTAAAYLRDLASLAPKAERVTDKMLLNVVHLGVISRLFPHARVIWSRRDPLDTCWSCFTTHFMSSLHFTADLADLGAAHRDVERLMRHWVETLDLTILPMQYESLVADPETHARELLEFVGLPWSERCLRFYEGPQSVATASAEQVRKPIYTTSVGRSRRYLAHLGPLVEALGLERDGLDAPPRGDSALTSAGANTLARSH